MSIDLEAGKRYIMRSGRLTGVIRDTKLDSFPFTDDVYYTWESNGSWTGTDNEHANDIVEEYTQKTVDAFNNWKASLTSSEINDILRREYLNTVRI